MSEDRENRPPRTQGGTRTGRRPAAGFHAARSPPTCVRLIGKPLGKRGFGEGGLIAEWPAVVGEEIARHAKPLKLAFPRGQRRDGTLTLLAPGASPPSFSIWPRSFWSASTAIWAMARLRGSRSSRAACPPQALRPGRARRLTPAESATWPAT